MQVFSLDQSEKQKRSIRRGGQTQAAKVGWRRQGGREGSSSLGSHIAQTVWCGVSKPWPSGSGAAARMEERAALPTLGVDFLIRQNPTRAVRAKSTNLSRCHSPHARRHSFCSDTNGQGARRRAPGGHNLRHSSSRRQVSIVLILHSTESCIFTAAPTKCDEVFSRLA